MNEMWVGKQVARVIFILILPLIGIGFLMFSFTNFLGDLPSGLKLWNKEEKC